MPLQIVIRQSAMGDILLAVPVLRALGRAGFETVLVINRKWKELRPFLPGRVVLLNEGPGLMVTARHLRRLAPDRVIDLQGKFSSRFLSLLLAAPTVRYRKRDIFENLRWGIGRYPLRGGDPDPVWKRYLRTAGFPDEKPDPGLDLPPAQLAESREFLGRETGADPGSIILIHPGASHPGKIFPAQGLEIVCRRVRRPVAIIGDASDAHVPEGVPDLRGRIPLSLLTGVLAAAGGVISTDSGPMHLARAVGAPLAAFFFQTDPSLGFSPIPGGRTRIFSRELPCKPCSFHGQRGACPEGTWNCRDLSWSGVAEEVAGFFGESGRP